MRFFIALTALLFVPLTASLRADEGGYKDPATGKVWSRSIASISGSLGDWQWSTDFAANYQIWDLNGQGVPTLYNDWRLPTLTELQQAYADGTMNVLHAAEGWQPNVTYALWASTTNGKKGKSIKYYTLWVTWVNDVAVSSEARLLTGGAGHAFMIRP